MVSLFQRSRGTFWVFTICLLFSNLALAEDKYSKLFLSQEATRSHFQHIAGQLPSEAWKGPKYSSKLDDEFSKLLSWFVNSKSTILKSNAIQTLQGIRESLPPQIRWLLAAVEIQEGQYSKQSLQDGYQALKSTELAESFTLDLGIFFSRGGRSLIYRDFGGGKISFQTAKEVLYVQSAWQQLPSLAKTLSLNLHEDPVLETSRVSWLRMLAKMESEVEVGQIRKAIELLNDPSNLKFSSSENKVEFLDQAIHLVSNLYSQYRRSSELTNGKLVTTQTGVEDYKATVEVVRTWIMSDIEFVLKNYDRLVRRGLLSADELLQRGLSPDEKPVALEFLRRKLKLPLDSYLLLSLLWMKSSNELPSSDFNRMASTAATEILFKAEKQFQGIKISASGFTDEHLSQLEYTKLLAIFHKVFMGPAKLSEDAAIKILEMRTPRTQTATDKSWYDWEWKRLACVENALPAESFKEKLIQILLKSSDLDERLLVARYLRLKLKVNDLDSLARKLKIMAQDATEKNFKGTQEKDWIAKEGQLIALINALLPTDPDLRNFLTKLYANRQVSGPVAGQSALMLLAEAGIASDEVKQEILRRLQFVGAGDSAGTFRAFIKLFPNEGTEIVAIIHRHRAVPEKLSLMLVHLVNQADQDPELVEAIKRGLSRQSDRAAGLALYQGLTLDNWIQQKLLQRNAIANQLVLSCHQVFRD